MVSVGSVQYWVNLKGTKTVVGLIIFNANPIFVDRCCFYLVCDNEDGRKLCNERDEKEGRKETVKIWWDAIDFVVLLLFMMRIRE